MKTKKMGFTLVEIMIVVAIIALLTTIAIPAFLKYRRDAHSAGRPHNDVHQQYAQHRACQAGLWHFFGYRGRRYDCLEQY